MYFSFLTDFTIEELKCFEKRYENGYDLADDLKYNKWKDQFHPEGTVNCLILSIIMSI